MAELLDELLDWLRIPSVSAGARDEAALTRAAEWAAQRVRTAGGTARRWWWASCAARGRTRRP